MKLKEWHRKHRRGTEMGNALARKARQFRKIPVVGWVLVAGEWTVDFGPLLIV